MQGGWLLRGLHHFTAQAMVVLLAIHLVQVVIDGAYRAPREVNFCSGLVLMQIVMGLALTGIYCRGMRRATGPRALQRTCWAWCPWPDRSCKSWWSAARNTAI